MRAELCEAEMEDDVIRSIISYYVTYSRILKSRLDKEERDCKSFETAVSLLAYTPKMIADRLSDYKLYLSIKNSCEIKYKDCLSKIERLRWEADYTAESKERLRKYLEEALHKATTVDVSAPPAPSPSACDRLFEERIREPVTVEEQLEFREHPLESKRVRLIASQWKKENRITNFTAEMVLCRMEDKYGKPEDGKVWKNIRMFSSDEDVAEWDKTH